MSATGAQEESEKNRQNRNFLLKNFVVGVDKSGRLDYYKCNITKMAVKRRVGFRIEPYQRARTVEKGRKQGTENGLGAAWAKCKSAKPATGTPVKASGCTPREPSSAPAAAASRPYL